MRRLRPVLARMLLGLKAGALAVGREVGMLEICMLAVAVGAYLVARDFLSQGQAAGVGLIVGGALGLVCKLLELARPERQT